MTAAKAWGDWPCLGFDLETTGTATSDDRIVQAALVEVLPGQRPKTTTWLVNPGVDIPAEAEAVHGISTAYAAEHGTDPGQMLFEVTGRLAHWMGRGYPVVAFNAAFDFSMLEAENARHSIDTLVDRLGVGRVSPVVDPMVLASYAEPYRKKICTCGCGATDKTLAGWCLHYKVTNVGAHDAAGDALAACRLWPRILAKHARKFPGMTMQALHQGQVGWRKAQCDRLREWFDSKGEEHDGFDPGWPLYQSLHRVPAVTPTAPTLRLGGLPHLSECPSATDASARCLCDDYSPEWTVA